MIYYKIVYSTTMKVLRYKYNFTTDEKLLKVDIDKFDEKKHIKNGNLMCIITSDPNRDLIQDISKKCKYMKLYCVGKINSIIKLPSNTTYLDGDKLFQKSVTDDTIKDLFNLIYLDLYWNKLVTPEGTKNLVNLEYLDMMFNGKVTDESIKNAIKLQYLELYSAKLITDKSIEKLINLRYLDLHTNKLVTNRSVKNLNELEYLNVCWNDNITFKGIEHLTKLNYFAMGGRPGVINNYKQ